MELSPLFYMGNFSFRIGSAQEGLISALSQLMPMAKGNSLEAALKPASYLGIFELPASEPQGSLEQGLFDAITFSVNKILENYKQYIWLDAVLLSNAKDELVLLTGQSQAGKTTLALALWLSLGWRVVAEDIVVIDPATAMVVPFVRPFSLRPGTRGKLAAATGIKLDASRISGDCLLDDWYYNPDCFAVQERPAAFCYAFHLRSLDPLLPGELSCQNISPGQYVNLLLAISNLIHINGAVDLLAGYLLGSQCYVIDGGDLPARLAKIKTLGGGASS